MKSCQSNVYLVTQKLDKEYKPTNLENKRNPLDELAFILLSTQTSEKKYHRVYHNFKRAFPRWELVAEANVADIQGAIWEGGLSLQKSRYLKQIVIQIKNDFGELSLRKLKKMSTEGAETYLTSLPGIGIKTARCILLYSLDREVFPADVHCLRVMERLGWIDWGGRDSIKIADEAQECVPPELRRTLHIRLVQHGRRICRPKPLCSQCVISGMCEHYNNAQ